MTWFHSCLAVDRGTCGVPVHTCCNWNNGHDERGGETLICNGRLGRNEVVKVRSRRRSSDSETMSLGFELPTGTTKEVVFSERPLGMKFTPSVPLTVTEVRPTGQANKLGVQHGWMLTSVDNETMDGQTSEYVIGILCKKASVLPLLYL